VIKAPECSLGIIRFGFDELGERKLEGDCGDCSSPGVVSGPFFHGGIENRAVGM